jgi:hypothetical protein
VTLLLRPVQLLDTVATLGRTAMHCARYIVRHASSPQKALNASRSFELHVAKQSSVWSCGVVATCASPLIFHQHTCNRRFQRPQQSCNLMLQRTMIRIAHHVFIAFVWFVWPAPFPPSTRLLTRTQVTRDSTSARKTEASCS